MPVCFRSFATVSVGTADGNTLRLIEYRRWNNNGPLPMRIWFRQEGKGGDPRDLTGWDGMLYREWEPEKPGDPA